MSRPRLSPLAVASALVVCATACAPAHTAMTPAPSVSAADVAARELTADQQVWQVLNRLAFGPRPGDVERVRAMGVDRWIDQQLHPERVRDDSMTALLAHFPTLAKSGAELLRDYPPPAQLLAQQARRGGGTVSAADSQRIRAAGRESYRVVGDLQTSKVARAVGSERQLEEVMVDFWENHFNVFAGKNRLRYDLPQYDAIIREHAFGKFRDLLGAVAKSDAMLQYLDNFQSIADSGHATLARQQFAAGRGGLRPVPLGGRPRPGAARRPDAAPSAMPNAMPETPLDTASLPPAAKQRLAAMDPAQRQQALARLAQMTPQQRAQLGQLAQLAARRPRGLNENYARELMELHTLGVDGGYTQKDVIEVARALTGWSIKGPQQGGGFVFRPEAHDADAKVILGHTFPAGRGIEDGEEVLDIVAHAPATAHFIAYKLARHFVSDTPPGALVDRAAATFTRTDGDIRETLRTIVTSPEFFSRAAFRAKVKSPFELVVSAARAIGAAPDTTPRTSQLIARLGEPVFGHADPNGYPETGDAWMNTGAILNRINFGLAVAANRLPGARLDAWPAAEKLRGASREQQADGVVAALFGGGVSPDTRAVLVSGENPLLGSARLQAAAQAARDSAAPDSTMTATEPTMTPQDGSAGNPRRAQRQANDPARAARESVKPGAGRAQPAIGQLPPLTGFGQIVGLALGAPEFQRH